MTARIIPFVPRNADGKPMLEQIALDAVEAISVPVNAENGAVNLRTPTCHDDLQGEGGSVLYESGLGYVNDEGC